MFKFCADISLRKSAMAPKYSPDGAAGNAAMGKKSKFAFDPKAFLATVDGGRTVSDYRKDDVVFSQGAPADAVFYIQKGKVKVAVTSEQGKEAVVAILDAGSFLGEGCLIGQPLRLAGARP
jgi:CRP/FNR family cyclic AMP-dependent transcriptional regulator